MMILDLPKLPLQLLVDRHLYNFYNDTFTVTVCSAAHFKNSCDELRVAVLQLGCSSCHATLCYTLLCFLSHKFLSFAVLDNTWSIFFFPSRRSILNLVYLYYFRSPICDFRSCSIPLSLISNSTGLTQFGFFKRELFPISHNALIMDCFCKENLYGVPRVIVSSFSSKIDRDKTKFCVIFSTFIEF